MKRFLPAAALALVVACGVKYVKGPDGKEDWFQVECRREVTCVKKAASRCPKGFFLNDPEMGTTSFTEKGPAGDIDDNAATKLRPMLARCGTEKDEERDRSNEEEEGFKPIAKPKDLSGCGRAYDNFEDLQTAWIEWHPGAEAAEGKPARNEFVKLCGELPEPAQFCMSVKYTRSHIDECSEALNDLPNKTKVRLARMLEKDGENPTTMKVAPPPPPPDLDAGAPDAAPADAGKDAGPAKPTAGKPGAKPTPAAKPAPDAGVKDAAAGDSG